MTCEVDVGAEADASHAAWPEGHHVWRAVVNCVTAAMVCPLLLAVVAFTPLSCVGKAAMRCHTRLMLLNLWPACCVGQLDLRAPSAPGSVASLRSSYMVV